MVETSNYLEFINQEQWRSWLEESHARESEAWVVIYKKKYRDHGLALDGAVEEALCFGWIDGVLNPLDEKRYTLRFSPRRGNSIWSMNNIRRAEKLIAQGKMTAAGSQAIAEAKENGEWGAAIRRERVDVIPEGLEKALRKHAGALAAYRALPDSRKKLYIYWLQSAKREATKLSRICKIIAEILDR